jgi:hypothetical protein
MIKIRILLIFIISLFFIFLSYQVNNINPEKLKEKSNLKVPVKLDEETMIKVAIGQITQGYGSSFKYLHELESGKYRVKKNGDFVQVDVLNNSRNYGEKLEIKDEFRLNYIKNKNGVTGLVLDNKDFNRLIDFNNKNKDNYNVFPPNFPTVLNNILWDQEILRYNEEYTLGKIFNRVIALDKTVNQNQLGSVVFYDIDDGILLPNSEGVASKLLISDGGWSSIIQFDANNTSEIDSYGSFGTEENNFIFNNGITYGRSYSQSGNTVYPVYIADIGNNRIIFINYIINNETGVGYFDKNTFDIFAKNLKSPYDISYFVSLNPTGANDKIWISEASAGQPTITCLSLNGHIVQRIQGYNYNLIADSLLKKFSRPRLCTYDFSVGAFGALVFIDDKRNVVVPCVLDTNGMASTYVNQNGDTIIRPWVDIITFPYDYPVTSVNIQYTTFGTAGYPYLWVTTKNQDDKIAMVNAFALNSNANWAYLGSSDKPRNSSYYFHDLTNSFSCNNHYDIFTSEIWSDAYGLRRYLPFIEVRDDYVESYCSDSTDRLLWKAAFTNECWIKLNVVNSISKEKLEIKRIEGIPQPPHTTDAVILRMKGFTGLTGEDPIDIKLNLPLKFYAFGGNIELSAKIYPEYFDYQNLEQYNEYITRNYEIAVSKNCLPRPGGCPFLYVKDVNMDYIPDNNILHKSEFSDGDITDLYKLRIDPFIDSRDGIIELALVENENDYGYINMAKLYAVDHQSSQKMAITENNDIVLYDSAGVVASDSVMLNNTNITQHVNYHNPFDTTIGSDGDQFYAHFSYLTQKNKFKNQNLSDSRIKTTRENNNKKQSLYNGEKTRDNTKYTVYSNEPVAFIANVGNLVYPNIRNKNNAGRLMAASINGNPVELNFARRELNSEVVIPLYSENDLTDYLNINWLEDFSLKYIGVTNNLSYNGYTKTEAPISEAHRITRSFESNIIDSLSSIDDSYGEVNDSALIKMKFDTRNLPALNQGYIREYVFEVNGRYYKADDKSMKKGNNEIPLTYKLSQNYPNPFNPLTKIKFEIPKTQLVNIVIFDILGREVKKLVNNEMKQAGRYVVDFDGTNFASGVYFYRIEAGTYVQSKKMVLVK